MGTIVVPYYIVIVIVIVTIFQPDFLGSFCLTYPADSHHPHIFLHLYCLSMECLLSLTFLV